MRLDQCDKKGHKESSWRWSGLKAYLQSLAAGLQQLILLSLIIKCRRM